MNKAQASFSYILGVSGITLSIENIKEVLSIVLLILSIANILIALVSRAYKRFKDGITIDDVKDTLNDVEDTITSIDEEIKKKEGKKNG